MKRVAVEPMEIGGTAVATGRVVMLSLAAANRDGSVFAQPDKFDVARGREEAIPFGVGPHFCVGGFLGKLEAEVLVETMLRRFPRMAAAGPVAVEPLALGGLRALPVTWDAIAAPRL